MSFGYLARNSNNNILISDRTYNTEFIGKATYVKSYSTGTYVNVYPTGADRTQYGQIQEFTINTGGRIIIPFIYSPSNYFVSVINVTYSGNTCTLQVMTQAQQKPTIYCFAKAASTYKSGWGMNVYDASGKTTFSSQSNMLIINSIYNAVTTNSSLYYTDYVRKDSITTGTRSNIYSNNPIRTSSDPVQKAAIFYNSHTTGSVYRSNSGSGYYYESGCKFDYATKQLNTWWLCLLFFAGQTVQVPQRDEVAIVIDGALYD